MGIPIYFIEGGGPCIFIQCKNRLGQILNFYITVWQWDRLYYTQPQRLSHLDFAERLARSFAGTNDRDGLTAIAIFYPKGAYIKYWY